MVPDLKPEQQAKTEWLVEMFMPFSLAEPNQLHITVDKKAAKAGETLDFQLQLSLNSDKESNNPKQVSYTVSHTLFSGLTVLGKGHVLSVE